MKKSDLPPMQRIQLYLNERGVEPYRYTLTPTSITWTLLVGEQRKKFLSFIKRLYGEHKVYNYSSSKRMETHDFRGFTVIIHNY